MLYGQFIGLGEAVIRAFLYYLAKFGAIDTVTKAWTNRDMLGEIGGQG